jgi:hypothetical protein
MTHSFLRLPTTPPRSRRVRRGADEGDGAEWAAVDSGVV